MRQRFHDIENTPTLTKLGIQMMEQKDRRAACVQASQMILQHYLRQGTLLSPENQMLKKINRDKNKKLFQVTGLGILAQVLMTGDRSTPNEFVTPVRFWIQQNILRFRPWNTPRIGKFIFLFFNIQFCFSYLINKEKEYICTRFGNVPDSELAQDFRILALQLDPHLYNEIIDPSFREADEEYIQEHRIPRTLQEVAYPTMSKGKKSRFVRDDDDDDYFELDQPKKKNKRRWSQEDVF